MQLVLIVCLLEPFYATIARNLFKLFWKVFFTLCSCAKWWPFVLLDALKNQKSFKLRCIFFVSLLSACLTLCSVVTVYTFFKRFWGSPLTQVCVKSYQCLICKIFYSWWFLAINFLHSFQRILTSFCNLSPDFWIR